jgi:membrane-associated protease RseP (regulator of RpoE activity)
MFGNLVDLGTVNLLRIDIGSLMTLIAVLHFIEALLVMFDGKRGAIPVFTNRNDKIIGGFALRRNWVLPVALFLIVTNSSMLEFTENIATPNWWPLLKSSPLLTMAKGAAVSLLAYFGIIGYSTVTFTRNKNEKVTSSGIALLLYGMILFCVALLAPLGYLYKLFIVVFAPAAHEFMLYIQRYIEMKGAPKYVSSDEGIMVLEVAPNSPAYEMGIMSGDLLVEVNGKKIMNEQEILTCKPAVYFFV